MTRKSFHDLLEKNATDWTDSAYIATESNGLAVGFFCYSVNTAAEKKEMKVIQPEQIGNYLQAAAERNVLPISK